MIGILNPSLDLSLFYEIVKKMNSETKKWDGDFTFVYIPSWDRFFNKNSNYKSHNSHLPQEPSNPKIAQKEQKK